MIHLIVSFCPFLLPIKTFHNGIKQEPDGRYTVCPLLKKDYVPLKNNYFLALMRCRALNKSLNRDPNKKKAYEEAINQMIINEEIEKLEENPKISNNMDALMNYISHHAVYKMD